MDAAQIIGPLSLFVLMLVVGLGLQPADFRRVLAVPRAVVGGTLAQLVLLPLMTWGVVTTLDVPAIFGAGAILVATSPGAGISNILTAVARANTALSVTLTAVASVLAVVTLPTLTALAVGFFLEDGVDLEVPVAMLVAQLAFSLLLPIGLGMWFRARWPEHTLRHGPKLQRAAMVVIALLVTLGVIFGDRADLSFQDAKLGLVAAGVWTAAAMAIGWTTAAALRLPPDDRFTFLVEFSARNIAVATIVALSGLERPDLALFSAAYLAVGYPTAAAAVFLRRLRLRRSRSRGRGRG
jgi:BASS family bile acid:Na+ symporter